MTGATTTSPKLQMTKTAPARRGPTGSGFQFMLLVVIIILFSLFVLKPQMAKHSGQRQAVAASQAALDDIRDNKAALASLVQAMHESQDDIQILDEALPIDNRVTKIHFMLDSIVKAAGMTLASVNLDGGQAAVAAGDRGDLEHPFSQERKLHTVSVTLNATGTIDQGIGMLQALESDARLVDVDSMDISSDGSGMLSFRLKLKLYYYSSQPTTAK